MKMGGIKDLLLVINLFEHFNEPAETSFHCSNFVVFYELRARMGGTRQGQRQREQKADDDDRGKNKSFKTVKFVLL